VASWAEHPKTYAGVPYSALDPNARMIAEREEVIAWELEHAYDHDEHDIPDEED
jgi:hypothetical protein